LVSKGLGESTSSRKGKSIGGGKVEEGIVFFRDFNIPADGGETDRATVFEQLLVFSQNTP